MLRTEIHQISSEFQAEFKIKVYKVYSISNVDQQVAAKGGRRLKRKITLLNIKLLKTIKPPVD